MKVIIAGGGTGGHLFPGIAVAREIQRRYPTARILFVGAEQGIEARVVPSEGFELRTLAIGGLKGKGVAVKVRNALGMISAFFTALQLLRSIRPDAVIGVGGYASFPLISAAIVSGLPRLIMEQNAMPGLANRTVGRWVDFAAVTDPRTVSYFEDRAVVTGNPVRPQFKSIPAKVHIPPYTILIFGGSQGAQSINKAVMQALEHLTDLKSQVRFVHQTGERQIEEVRAAYEAAGFRGEVRSFFNDFHEQYAAADLIVSRSGATTVAEIKAAGRAAILVPFPFATDDHQMKNAQSMAEQKAAILIRNDELSGERLAKEIRDLLMNPSRLNDIETSARHLAMLDAETRIVNLMETAIERHHRH